METDNAVETPESPQPLPADVCSSFRVSLGEREATWNLSDTEPGLPLHYFVRAHEPGSKEDKITQAAYAARFAGKRRRRGGDDEAEVAIQPLNYFKAKCLHQIRDFCVPGIDKQGRECDFRFNPANQGDNIENLELYGRFFFVASLRRELEGFLDWLAARVDERTGDLTDAALDFEDLKNAHGERLSTS